MTKGWFCIEPVARGAGGIVLFLAAGQPLPQAGEWQNFQEKALVFGFLKGINNWL